MPAPSENGDIIEVLNSGLTGSQTVTIPAGTDMLLVGIAYYPDRVYNFVTIGGNGLTAIDTVADSGTQNAALWYIVNPPTGSQTFAWSVDVITEGAIYHLIPLKDVNTSSPITGFAKGGGSTTPTTAPFSSTANDTIYFVVCGYNGTVDAGYGPGQTELIESAVFNTDVGAIGTKAGVAGTTTVQVEGPDGYTAVVAVSIAGTAGGGGGGTFDLDRGTMRGVARGVARGI